MHDQSIDRPRVVIFDLGKVLVDFDYSIAARRIAAHSNLSPAQVQTALDHSPLLQRYETGLMTRSEFYEAVRTATGFSGSLREFSSWFADIFTEMPEMINLHGELRGRGIPTFIFSNTNDLAIEHIRKRFPFFASFDGYILSYEVGAMKPDAKIYEALENLTGRDGSEILYIDDRPENIAAGASRRWQTILQVDSSQTRSAVTAFGLLS